MNEVESYQMPLPKLRPPRACSRVNEVACYTRASEDEDFSVLVLVSDEVLKKIPRRRKKPFSPTSKLVGAVVSDIFLVAANLIHPRASSWGSQQNLHNGPVTRAAD